MDKFLIIQTILNQKIGIKNKFYSEIYVASCISSNGFKNLNTANGPFCTIWSHNRGVASTV